MQLASGPVFSEDNEIPPLTPLTLAPPLATSTVLLAAAYLTSGVLQFFLVWIALAFIVGPFAPRSITGGDCRVGVGHLLEEEPESKEDEAAEEDAQTPDARPIRSNGSQYALADLPTANGVKPTQDTADVAPAASLEPTEWTKAEYEQLKKLLVKFPRGTPQRWEAIAGVLGGGGRRSGADVAQAAKAIGLQKPSDRDAYASFLANRKSSGREDTAAPSIRTAEGNDDSSGGGNRVGSSSDEGGGKRWSEAQDRALLQALREFPKETAKRWDRVAAAVPGGWSKQQCFKRFSELREGYRKSGGKEKGEGKALEEEGDEGLE